MNEIKINKKAQSITFINNGIAFSQFGIAKEILDLVDNQQQEIERLNKIIEIKNNRIQQLMKRTRSARIDKAIEYIEDNLYPVGNDVNGSDLPYDEAIQPLVDILKGVNKE